MIWFIIALILLLILFFFLMYRRKEPCIHFYEGSLGLGKSLLQRANYRLCFSKMTFPHQLMKLILVEQVYRAYKIMRRETYHK